MGMLRKLVDESVSCVTADRVPERVVRSAMATFLSLSDPRTFAHGRRCTCAQHGTGGPARAACRGMHDASSTGMFQRGSLTLFRVRGVPIRAHWTLLLILPYLALVLSVQFRA